MPIGSGSQEVIRQNRNYIDKVANILKASKNPYQMEALFKDLLDQDRHSLANLASALKYIRDNQASFGNDLTSSERVRALTNEAFKYENLDFNNKEELLQTNPGINEFINSGFERDLPEKVLKIFKKPEAAKPSIPAVEGPKSYSTSATPRAPAIPRETPAETLARISEKSKRYVKEMELRKRTEAILGKSSRPADNASVASEPVRPYIPSTSKPPAAAGGLTRADLDRLNASNGTKPFPVPEDRATTATGTTTRQQRELARDPEKYLEERRKIRNAEAEELNNRSGFQFEAIDEPKVGEDYNVTAHKWLVRQAQRLAKSNPEAMNFNADEDPLTILGAKDLHSNYESMKHRTDEEKALGSLNRQIVGEGHIPTESENLSKEAIAPISPKEIKEHEGAYYDDLMKRIERRAKERFIESKEDRYKKFNQELAGRYQGSAWNSGARREFERDFNDQERRRERDYMEQMKDAEIQLLHQGNFEGWGRAMANRDRQLRGAQQLNTMGNDRFNRVNQAARDNAILGESRRQNQLNAAQAMHDIGLQRQGRNQSRLDRENAAYQQQMNQPMNSLNNLNGLIRGFPTLPPQPFQPMPIPEPQRSTLGTLGGLGMAGYSMYNKNRLAEAQINALQNIAKQGG